MTSAFSEEQLNPKNNDAGPSRGWYVLALLIFVLCSAGIVASVYHTVRSFPQGTQFLVPGSVAVAVEQPGNYSLLDELSTFFQGKHYESSGELPAGLEIRVRDRSSGRQAVFSPSSAGTEQIGTVRRKAVGCISFDAAGTYVIEVSGSFSERVFYVRPPIFPAIWRGLATVTMLGFAGWLVAPVIAVIVYAKRCAARGAVRPAAVPSPSPAGSTPAAATDDERTYAMFCHFGALTGFFIPFGNIIVPLILWVTKKDASAFIDQQGKEALNFQLSLLLYTFLSALLILLVIGIFLLAGLMFFNLVIVIIAGVRAKSGEPFRYPLTIRFIS